ncbi:MAG TPA: phage tail tube protein [Caldilineaceae bacterium]|nr:phage tail tube protein [Caldilineaceae bacterium]
MANKYLGFPVTLGTYNGSTYDTIAGVRDIDGPGLSRDTVEVSSRSSTNRWREFLAGMIDGGEVSFDIVYDPAETTHKNASTGLLALQVSGAATMFRMGLPASVNWDFTAIVTKFQPTAPLEDALTASITFKITGQPTLA